MGKLYQGGNWWDIGALKKQIENLITVKRNQRFRVAVREIEAHKRNEHHESAHTGGS